jgi:hypothetical protein
VPVRFKALSTDFSFYWMRFPMILKPPDNLPYVKLEFAVEFNPDTKAGHLRPRAHTILPDRKFAQQLEVSGSLDIHLGEDLEFEAGAGVDKVELPPIVPGVGAIAGGRAAVDAKLASSVGAPIRAEPPATYYYPPH